MLLTLISMLGGGAMRLLPEIFSLLTKKQDYAHELAMLDRQAALEQSRSQARLDEITTQGNFTDMLALLDAQKEALKGQMQPTGIRFVDALNFLVRPLTTYYFLGCYGIYKTALLVIAIRQVDAWTAILQCYTENDMNILASILAFWFVGRTVDRNNGVLK
jgi:hypothetical protein